MSADGVSRCGPGSRPVRGEDESGEKEELIGQILELQNTLQDLSQRINSVKEENSKLKSENQASSRIKCCKWGCIAVICRHKADDGLDSEVICFLWAGVEPIH